GERGDDVLPLAPLEHTCLFAYHLEGRGNPLLGKEHRQALGGVIALRQDVVFRVKPEKNVDLPLRRIFRLRPLLAGTSEVRDVEWGWRRILARSLPRRLSPCQPNPPEQNR